MTAALAATINLCQCCRCGGPHEGLRLKKLSRPSSIGILVFTHWAMCPIAGEPILVAFAETP